MADSLSYLDNLLLLSSVNSYTVEPHTDTSLIQTLSYVTTKFSHIYSKKALL